MNRTTQRKARKLGLFAILGLAATLGGCIVNTAPRSGILEVRWETGTCINDGIATVEINVRRSGITEGSSGPVLCTKGFHAFSVQSGVYDVAVRAFSNAGSQVASAEASNVIVNANRTTTTQIVGLTSGGGGGGGRTGGGSVTLSWTVKGEIPSQGCAKTGIKDVTISILNHKRTLVSAHATVPCTTGKVTITNVPTGAAYVQLDGTTADKLTYFGNLQLHGPITIQAGSELIIPAAIDIEDLRSSVAVQWQFKNNNTCAGNNISNVFIEVRDAKNKVVIPMNAADAKKPCEIDTNTAYADRVIDMMFSTPTCTVPAGAKGLVICGITGTSIGIRLGAQDATTGNIVFGGSMEVKQIPAGTHTNLPTNIALSACTAGNPCVGP